MKKQRFYTELAYVFGLVILAFGTAFMERAGFGVSMIVAPAYLLHLKVVEYLPFFSFGMAEYTLQAVLLLVTTLLLRRAKFAYFFSLVTAVIYGFLLDGAMAVVGLIPGDGMVVNTVFYLVGLLLGPAGVSLLFHTYISPEAYELFVKEVSAKFRVDIHKFKTIYDCASCLLGILLSFAFFGLWHFEGIKLGTILCAILNGSLIRLWTKGFERVWTFEDRFPLRKYF